MPLSTEAQVDKKIGAQFENCVKRIIMVSTSFNDQTGIEERREVLNNIITQQHALLPSFNADHLIKDWLDYKIVKGKDEFDVKNIKVTAGNLYSFVVLCGETPAPYDWLDEEQYKGELGFYKQWDACFTLKRRFNHKNTKAKIDRHTNE